MSLNAGDKLGPYEILAPLGAGGMGEVFQARDTRLNRTVAIKTSKTQFSERFEREARAVAALNHPNICTLHDVGALPDQAGYLVFEHVEGEPLLTKAKPGPMPLERALDYASQICAALDAAHSKHIIHRDLKPANILVTRQGIKLLDFGLARFSKESAGTPVAGFDDSTRTMAITGEGAILGTLHYMSPEQINGKEADARSDIFSFGLVLFEMLTGRKAFPGDTAASVMGAILERPAPSITDVAPTALDRVLKKCLEKDPEDRWQSARDLKTALELAIQAAPMAGPLATTSRPASKLPWLTATAGALAAVGLGLVAYRHFREVAPEPVTLQYTIDVPADVVVPNVEISPDGRKLVLQITKPGGSQLWLRDLATLEMHPVAGTEGATFPFWSPDSQNIGFFDGASVKRVSATGGSVLTLCTVAQGQFGTWGGDGTILFGAGGGIMRVSASGGTPTEVIDDATQPSFVPAGGRFLYTKADGIYLSTLDGHAAKIAEQSSEAKYWAPAGGGERGYVLLRRQRALMAQPVDSQALRPTGEAFPVAGLENFVGQQGLRYSVSGNGTLVFTGTPGNTQGQQLFWRDRIGKRSEAIAGTLVDFGLSPNAKKVALERPRPGGGGTDLWVADLEHKTESRLTFDDKRRVFTPVWSPDSAQLAYNYQAKGVFRRTADGSDQEKPVFQGPGRAVSFDWTDDGKFILVSTADSHLAVPAAGGKPVPFLAFRRGQSRFQVSPDGRWVAYTSTESGRLEVYVQPFAPGSDDNTRAGKWQVSTAGGSSPRWRGDGKELFYQALDAKIMAVVTRPEGGGFEYSTPKELFAPQVNLLGISTGGGFGYAVTQDGQRFLLREDAEQKADKQNLVVWVNWLAGVKR